MNHINAEFVLEHWRQGKSTLDWRQLTTIKEKKEWLKACLFWTGLPCKKIKSFDYIIDGNQVILDLDFYCLMGESFFGYRGYLGQDSHGLMDCFLDIALRTNDKEIVENGARIVIKNSAQVREVLQDDFQYIVERIRGCGFGIDLD